MKAEDSEELRRIIERIDGERERIRRGLGEGKGEDILTYPPTPQHQFSK